VTFCTCVRVDVGAGGRVSGWAAGMAMDTCG